MQCGDSGSGLPAETGAGRAGAVSGAGADPEVGISEAGAAREAGAWTAGSSVAEADITGAVLGGS